MKNKNKKIGILLLSLMLLLCVALSGCSKETASTSGSGGASGTLTRGDYAGMVGAAFGYNDYVSETAIFNDVDSGNEHYAEIQACAEWDAIPSGGSFEPNKEATLEFAIDTAVRAIGLDKINTSGINVDETSTVDFYKNNIAQIDDSGLDEQVDSVIAQQVLDYAVAYRNNLTLPQVCEVEMVGGVKTVESGVIINADGATGRFEDGSTYAVGDILYLPPTDSSFARGVRITSINGNQFEFTDAAFDETIGDFKISGTYDAKVVNAITAAEIAKVVVGDGEEASVMSCGLVRPGSGYEMLAAKAPQISCKSSSNQVVFVVSFDQESKGDTKVSGHAEFSVGIKNIKVTTDFERSVFKLKKAEATVNFDTEIRGEVDGHISRSIPLGEVDLQMGALPVLVRVSLNANLGADGTISVTYTTKNSAYMGWREGSKLSKSFSSGEPSLQIKAEVTLTAEATAVIDLRIGWGKVSESLVNAEVTSGVVAVAKLDADILSNEPVCTDVLVYVPLRWGVNQRGCILTAISNDLKHSQVVWDSESSPIQKHWHWENGAEVPECTRGKEREVVVEEVNEEGKPYDEYDLFDFEPLDFGFIELDSYTMYLDPGESMKIGVISVPDGYSTSDLTYSVDDSSICKVSSDGTVTGLASGGTIVTVKTSDGNRQTSLAVVVAYEYDNVDGFEAL